MKPRQIVGVILLVVCVTCLFVAIERYNANAQTVRAMSGMIRALGGQAKAATPTATKYALWFAFLSGGGGLFCFLSERKS